MSKITKRITPQEAMFCREFVKSGMNRREATAKVFPEYSQKAQDIWACDLLKRPDVKNRIKALCRDGNANTVLTVEKVLEDLETVKEKALEGYFDAQGNKRYELNSYLRATELQGKYLSMFTEKVELNLDAHSKLINVIKQRQGKGDEGELKQIEQ